MKKNNTTEKSILNAEKLTKALKEGTEKTLQSIINEAIGNLIREDEDKDPETDDVIDSQPRDLTWVFRIAGRRFTIWATRGAHLEPGE